VDRQADGSGEQPVPADDTPTPVDASAPEETAQAPEIPGGKTAFAPPAPDRRERFLSTGLTLAASIAAIAAAVPLAVLSMLGFFVRPVSDDWCAIGTIRDEGAIGLAKSFYQDQNGRVTNALVTGVVYADGTQTGIRVMPILMIATIALGLVVLILQLATLVAWEMHWALAAALSTVTTVIVFVALPAPYHTLLWAPGTISHVLPSAIGIWLLVMAIAATGRRTRMVAVAVVFAAGVAMAMLSEPFTLVALSIGGVFLIAQLVMNFRDLRRYSLVWNVAMMVGLLIGFAILWTSPGLKHRREVSTSNESPFSSDVLGGAFDGWGDIAQWMWDRDLHYIPLVVGVLVGLGMRARAGAILPTGRLRVLLLVAPVPAVLLSTFIVAFSLRLGYGENGWQLSRAWFNFMVPFALALVYYGVLAGMYVAQWTAGRAWGRFVVVPVLGVAALAVVLNGVWETAEVTERVTAETVQRASAWDAQDARIRGEIALGARTVPYKPLRIESLGEPFMKAKKNDVIRPCVSRYYEIDDVVPFAR